MIVVIEDIKKGDAVEYDFEGKMYKFESLEDIKLYHKMAIEDIKKR